MADTDAGGDMGPGVDDGFFESEAAGDDDFAGEDTLFNLQVAASDEQWDQATGGNFASSRLASATGGSRSLKLDDPYGSRTQWAKGRSAIPRGGAGRLDNFGAPNLRDSREASSFSKSDSSDLVHGPGSTTKAAPEMDLGLI